MDNSLNQLISQTQVIPTEADRLDNLKPDPGFPDGTVVTNPHGEQEKIVYDKDANGTVIGFHKEVVNG